jgi:hypothetical protein
VQTGGQTGRADLLQAETLRNDEAKAAVAVGAGEAGFTAAGASCGEAASPSREDSSCARLRPVIRAHRKARGRYSRDGGRRTADGGRSVAGPAPRVHSRLDEDEE